MGTGTDDRGGRDDHRDAAGRSRDAAGCSLCDLPTPDLDLPTPDLDRATGLIGGGADGDGRANDEPERAVARERPESTVDTAPLIGMAALAVGAVVLRTVTSDGE